MDSRTRVRHAIERKPLDRVPRFDSFWEDTIAAWVKQGYPKDVPPDDYFDWDFATMSLDISMRQEQRLLKDDGEFRTVQDRHGYTIRKAIGKSRTIEVLDHVTRDMDSWNQVKAGFTLDPRDKSRLDDASYFLHMEEYPTWEEVRHKYDRLRKTDKYLLYHAYGPWEGTWRHRGYSELMMDLVTAQDWVGEMAGTLGDLLIGCLDHCIQLDMKPDGLLFIDDLGCNKGLLFSPDTWRRVFKPTYRKLGAFLRESGISFCLHSCGNCEPLIDDFIECGLEVLQPLQVRAGMDVRTLKSKYGDKLTFWGNIDATKMSGTADECEAEVRDKITSAKEGGGYIYHSDHSVPPEVTFERYEWIMELLDECGRY